MSLGIEGNGGGEGFEKTLDFRIEALILSTRVTGDSSLSGGARNTSDRRTDPNMSCICVVEIL